MIQRIQSIQNQTASHPSALRAFVAAAAWAVVAVHVPEASALDACKAKLSPKDGAILVSARSVAGVLEWGNTAAQVTNSFSNAATCLADGKATKCELGAAGSAQRITPPELCTVFLKDGLGDTCAAFLKGCTPGLRAVSGGFVAKSGDIMTGPLRAFSLESGFTVPGCGGGDVCAFSRLLTQGDAIVGGALEVDSSIRQSSSAGGVVKGGLVVQCDNSPTILRFFNTTGTGAFAAGGAGVAAFGECIITTPFAVNNRFVVATGINDNSIGFDEIIATVEIVGTNQIHVKRSAEVSGIMTGNNGPVSILIY